VSADETLAFRHSATEFHLEATIDSLTSRQRATLKSLAHGLKPLLHIGKGGVSESTAEAIREAFTTRELLKVRVLDSAPEPAAAIGSELVSVLEDVHLVQVIGRTVILFRANPEDPGIELPAPTD
jgi:RNA-binding protein